MEPACPPTPDLSNVRFCIGPQSWPGHPDFASRMAADTVQLRRLQQSDLGAVLSLNQAALPAVSHWDMHACQGSCLLLSI